MLKRSFVSRGMILIYIPLYYILSQLCCAFTTWTLIRVEDSDYSNFEASYTN